MNILSNSVDNTEGCKPLLPVHQPSLIWKNLVCRSVLSKRTLSAQSLDFPSHTALELSPITQTCSVFCPKPALTPHYTGEKLRAQRGEGICPSP